MKLPLANPKSTAALVKFCAEKIEGPGGLHLWVDGNQKITCSNGTYEDPKPNAFSLLQVDDCPYRTPTCEASCYVHGLEKHAKSTHDLYRHNSDIMRGFFAGMGLEYYDSAAYRLADSLCDWLDGNLNSKEFRWHVSGDVFSPAYAKWIQHICIWSPVNHWIYTRSFVDSAILAPLLTVSTTNGGNLALNLSADRDNYWLARRVADKYGLRVCYMATDDGYVPPDLRPGDVIFPDYALRAPKTRVWGDGPLTPHRQRAESTWYQSLTPDQRRMVCPVDFYGKSERVRCGPCKKCLV